MSFSVDADSDSDSVDLDDADDEVVDFFDSDAEDDDSGDEGGLIDEKSSSQPGSSGTSGASGKRSKYKKTKDAFSKLIKDETSTASAPLKAPVVQSVKPPIKNPRLIGGYKETAYERDMREATLKKSTALRKAPSIVLTEDQKRLLYLISLYSYSAKSDSERERCIRKTSLLVLVFEGIVAHVFDYDYAPASVMVGNPPRRVFLNVSQEGRDDIDDLADQHLVKSVRLASKYGSTDSAYQLAPRGVEALDMVKRSSRASVDAIAHDPKNREYLLEVEWKERAGTFMLRSAAGYERRSAATDAEDVSYVSTAFIPSSLRLPSSKEVPHDYSDQAREAAAGCASIKDEMSELLHLGGVRMLMGEYIPFGSNQMAALNDRLGSDENVQGGSFSSQLDDDKFATQLAVNAGMTSVRVLDFKKSRHVNCEASIDYPEDDGIVQIENFGLNIRDNGGVVLGLRVDSVMDRVRDELPIDLLARLMVDVHLDSSSLLDSLISPYQRSVLDVVYRGHSMQRPKYSIIVAENISPKMLAHKYTDGEDHENELKQVIGDVYGAYDLDTDELLINGTTGLILVGRDVVRRHEQILVALLMMRSVEIFVHALFSRIFELNDALLDVHRLLDTFERDPLVSSTKQVRLVREGLSGASRIAVRLHESLFCLKLSLEKTNLLPEAPERDSDKPALRLRRLVGIDELYEDLKNRVNDLDRSVDGSLQELSGLRQMSAVVRDSLLVRITEQQQLTQTSIKGVYNSSEKSSTSLEIVQILLVGLVAFGVLDRVVGQWSILDTEWAKNTLKIGLELPGVWAVVSVLAWLGGTWWAGRSYKWRSTKSAGGVRVRMRCSIPISITSLRFYIRDKDISDEIEDYDARGDVKTVTWKERFADRARWRGSPPRISVTFDEKAGLLRMIDLYAPEAYRNWRKGDDMLSAEVLRELFLEELQRSHVLMETEQK